MPTNIIRVRLRDSLPCQEERNEVLRSHYGDDVVFHEFTPSEGLGDLFPSLGDRVFQLLAVAIEMDSRDRVLAALLGAGAWMKVFNAPVLYPMFQNAAPGDTDPATFPMVFDALGDVLIPKVNVKFIGYSELVDANAITKLSEVGR